jgi:flagellar FliL protein
MAGSTKKEEPKAEAEAAPEKGGKKKVLVGALAALILAGGGWFQFLKPTDASAEPEAPTPGVVLTLEPINLNLADGHYLKLGMALQMVEGGGHGEPDGSHALDLAISQLSGKAIGELASPEGREKAKGKLLHAVEEAYHHEVMDIYFTEFVMQ